MSDVTYINNEGEAKVLTKLLAPTSFAVKAFFLTGAYNEAYGFTSSGAYTVLAGVSIPYANWTITNNIATTASVQLNIPAASTVHGVALVDTSDNKAFSVMIFDTPMVFTDAGPLIVNPTIEVKEEV